MWSSVVFVIIFSVGIGFLVRNIRRLVRNIKLGRSAKVSSQRSQRWKMMLRLALGQGKMTDRPISGLLHIVVYLGFFAVNIELLEIVIDGIFATHRIFRVGGIFYDTLIAVFEIFAVLVLIAVSVFWWRRNIMSVARFQNKELEGWAKKDANNILYWEALLMILFLLMNASDYRLQQLGELPQAGIFPVSSYLSFILPKDIFYLKVIERSAWWLHIVGILGFVNYLYYSKHLHIILAFPTTYYGSKQPRGQLQNLPSVTREVRLMMGESDPSPEESSETMRFGVCDATDLTWIQLMSAYSCTECGRCTDACPANQTGKLLSPRKVMMGVRDRIEAIGDNIERNKGTFQDDGKNLMTYIQPEEIWACTSCNACVEACPININPLEIIIGMRQYLVMEESSAPQELLAMMNNMENNAAPWPYNSLDRMKWSEELH